mmetsp:Transcript_37482/g.67799  ORF Transcript_37482/g.67799 Transcript_37482/m.67799 type:complete len:264 (-) Transcript_37482:48-839(-)
MGKRLRRKCVLWPLGLLPLLTWSRCLAVGTAGDPKKTRLYIVRHGAVIPPGNRKGAIYGGADVELSEQGKEEAEAAADYLLEEAPDLDAVYSSNLSRAIYGAEKIAEGRNLKVVTDARFTEINRGVWVGLNKAEIEERYPEHVKQIGSLSNFEADTEFSQHGGESYRAVGRRVLAARDDLLAKHHGQTVCLVCHNWVTAALLGSALGLSTEEWYTLKIPTASVSLVEYSSKAAQNVVFMGKSPEEFTNGRLKENVGSALSSKG